MLALKLKGLKLQLSRIFRRFGLSTHGHVGPKTGAVEGKQISCSYSAQWFHMTKTRRK